MGDWPVTIFRRFGVYVAVLGLAALVVWYYGYTRYVAGQDDRTAHYEPILAAIDAAGKAKNKASEARESLLNQRFQILENRYAQLEADSTADRRARDGRIGGLVQNLASCRIQQMSAAPTDPVRTAAAARVAARAREIGSAFQGIGDAAKRDALRFARCFDTLEAERQ